MINDKSLIKSIETDNNIIIKQRIDLTIITAVTARTKAIAPGKILLGMYGTNVDHIICNQICYKGGERLK